MTREEAATIIERIADFAQVAPGGIEIHRWDKETAIKAMRAAIAALREPSYNWNVKECADIIAAMSEGETLTIWKKNGFLNAVRGKTIDAWKPLLADKEEGEHGR